MAPVLDAIGYSYYNFALVRLLNRCQKPDRAEFTKVARLTAMGFLATGLIGFFVKLIFIPINQVCEGWCFGD